MGKRYVIHEEDDTSDGVIFLILAFVVTAVGFVIAVFLAFVLVGIVWGTIKSIYNYICGAIRNSIGIGATISYAWNGNVEDMQHFFQLANVYDGVLPTLIKTFLVMAGVGIIIVGTVLLPVLISIHLVIYLIVLPFRLIFGH